MDTFRKRRLSVKCKSYPPRAEGLTLLSPAPRQMHFCRQSKGSKPMQTRSLDAYDPLEDFLPRKITLNEATKMVHVSGSGPAVIVIPEVPGISPHVARFA